MIISMSRKKKQQNRKNTHFLLPVKVIMAMNFQMVSDNTFDEEPENALLECWMLWANTEKSVCK